MFFNSLILAAGVFFISVPSIASAFDVGLNPNPSANVSKLDAAGKGLIKELGTHSLRLGFRAGKYLPNVDWAVQNGMGVLLFLGYTQGCASPITPAGRQCYADRSAGLAQELGSKAQYYEVWNEWNGGFGLGCNWKQPPCNNAAMYTDLLCKTYTAVKAVRPSAIVVGGAIAGAHEVFLRGMLNAGAGNCMDMLSLHLYVYNPTAPSRVPPDAPASVGVDTFIQVMNARENLVKAKTGRTIPILVTEAGFHGADDQREADFITELYERSSAVPFIEGIWWYKLKDGPKGSFGLLRNDNTKKWAFFAFQAAANK